MWAQYGGVIGVIPGGLFLSLMVRGGGCGAEHGSHEGYWRTPEQRGQYSYETL